MNRLLPFLLFLSLLSASAQPILRSALSTNTSTAAAAVGEIMQWNGAAWAPVNQSNVINAALSFSNVYWVCKDGNATGLPAYDSISNALVAIPNNSVLNICAGSYTNKRVVTLGTNLSVPLLIRNKTNITINGYGVTIMGTNDQGEFMLIQNSRDITIKGITFDGGLRETTEPTTNGYGLICLSSNLVNLTFKDISLKNSSAQGMFQVYHLAPCHNLSVDGWYAESIGSTNAIVGLGIPDGAVFPSRWHKGVRIQNGYATNVNRVFESDVTDYDAEGIFLHNIVAENVWERAVMLVGYPGNAGQTKNITISDCIFRMSTNSYIQTQVGVFMNNVEDAILDSVSTVDSDIGVYIISGSGTVGASPNHSNQRILINNSKFARNKVYGIYIANYTDRGTGIAQDIDIVGGYCDSMFLGAPIVIAGGKDIRIRDFTCYDYVNGASGINIYSSATVANVINPTNISITGCTFENGLIGANACAGIWVDAAADGVRIGDNFYPSPGTLGPVTNLGATLVRFESHSPYVSYGRVGIGTNAPSKPLAVVGNAEITGNAAASILGATTFENYGNWTDAANRTVTTRGWTADNSSMNVQSNFTYVWTSGNGTTADGGNVSLRRAGLSMIESNMVGVGNGTAKGTNGILMAGNVLVGTAGITNAGPLVNVGNADFQGTQIAVGGVSATGSGGAYYNTGSGWNIGSAMGVGWASTAGAGSGSRDTAFWRLAAGAVTLGNNNAGNFTGTLSLSNLNVSANVSATNSFKIGNAASPPTWTSGSGTPEGAVTAPVGSIYSRTDGGAATSFYVKESGTGNTGWVGK